MVRCFDGVAAEVERFFGAGLDGVAEAGMGAVAVG